MSPFHIVPRKDPKDWHPCGDGRAPSMNTLSDGYLLPHLHDFIASVAGYNLFTALNIGRAYHQISLIHLTS